MNDLLLTTQVPESQMHKLSMEKCSFNITCEKKIPSPCKSHSKCHFDVRVTYWSQCKSFNWGKSRVKIDMSVWWKYDWGVTLAFRHWTLQSNVSRVQCSCCCVSYFSSKFFQVMWSHGCGCENWKVGEKKYIIIILIMQPCKPCTVYSVAFGGLWRCR